MSLTQTHTDSQTHQFSQALISHLAKHSAFSLCTFLQFLPNTQLFKTPLFHYALLQNSTFFIMHFLKKLNQSHPIYKPLASSRQLQAEQDQKAALAIYHRQSFNLNTYLLLQLFLKSRVRAPILIPFIYNL